MYISIKCKDCGKDYSYEYGSGLKASRCPSCKENRIKARRKAWNASHKDIVAQNNKAFYAENREREKARAKKWRDENPERVSRATAKWRDENKDRHLKMKRAWFAANKDSRKEYRRRKYQENRETELAGARIWKAKNAEALAEKQREMLRDHPERNRYFRSMRRAAERNATPAWADKKRIKAIYEQAAIISEETGVLHHVDHIVPLK